jgi:small subunit ribosomal protein S17
MAEAKKLAKTKAKESKKEKDKDAEPPEEPTIPKKIKKAMDIQKVQAKRKIKPTTVIRRKKVAKKVERKPRDIGIDVTPPDDSCNDSTCPFHGILPVRGQIIDGIVISNKMDKSVVVTKERLRFIPKYERYEKRSSNYTAHNPTCIHAQLGEKVKIMECRPLSKTKSFVVIERMMAIRNQ